MITIYETWRCNIKNVTDVRFLEYTINLNSMWKYYLERGILVSVKARSFSMHTIYKAKI